MFRYKKKNKQTNFLTLPTFSQNGKYSVVVIFLFIFVFVKRVKTMSKNGQSLILFQVLQNSVYFQIWCISIIWQASATLIQQPQSFLVISDKQGTGCCKICMELIRSTCINCRFPSTRQTLPSFLIQWSLYFQIHSVKQALWSPFCDSVPFCQEATLVLSFC